MLINYIRHDLEGVYTAELLRGSLSMLLAALILLNTEFTPTSPYILIVALYGLRSITRDSFFKRLGNICISLFLLIAVLVITTYLGQTHQYLLNLILTTTLSTLTVWALTVGNKFSGTVMFMSVFAIVNFGMGMLDVNHEINLLDLIFSSSIGGLCVLLSVIIVPIIGFHWCALINMCFYHDLKALCNTVIQAHDYGNFSNLTIKERNKIITYESSLIRTTEYVRQSTRKGLYKDLLNDLVLVICWPANHTDKNHLEHVNIIRKSTLSLILELLNQKNHIPTEHIENKILELEKLLNQNFNDSFCNGEMKTHLKRLINKVGDLIQWELINKYNLQDM